MQMDLGLRKYLDVIIRKADLSYAQKVYCVPAITVLRVVRHQDGALKAMGSAAAHGIGIPFQYKDRLSRYGVTHIKDKAVVRFPLICLLLN